MTNWDKYEETGSCGFPSEVDLFDQNGFITPWTLVDATNRWFGTVYTQQDGYDMIPHTTVDLWDVCEGWFKFNYVTREDAWLWVESHRNRNDWLATGRLPRT
jgi:hypothetical protein